MLLAIDAGNTNTVFAVYQGLEKRAQWRAKTDPKRTADEYAVWLTQLMALEKITPDDVDDAIIASVVPAAMHSLIGLCKRYFEVEPLVVGPGVRTGMPIRYDPPQDVGADRIVTAVAAYERYGGGPQAEHGIIVVDFGTATTFDVVSPHPEYRGGVIAPGIGIASDALFSRAAKLPRVDIARPERVVGRHTVGAIQSGLVYGYIGLVEGLIARIRQELDWECRVVATGGFASIVAEESSALDVVDDALVLEGLRLIHQRNQARPSPRK